MSEDNNHRNSITTNRRMLLQKAGTIGIVGSTGIAAISGSAAADERGFSSEPYRSAGDESSGDGESASKNYYLDHGLSINYHGYEYLDNIGYAHQVVVSGTAEGWHEYKNYDKEEVGLFSGIREHELSIEVTRPDSISILDCTDNDCNYNTSGEWWGGTADGGLDTDSRLATVAQLGVEYAIARFTPQGRVATAASLVISSMVHTDSPDKDGPGETSGTWSITDSDLRHAGHTYQFLVVADPCERPRINVESSSISNKVGEVSCSASLRLPRASQVGTCW